MKIYSRTERDTAPFAQPDPYMIKAKDGRYYMYTTQGQVYSSDNLLEGWKYEGIQLCMPGQCNCWAPSVIEQKGIYYMYYSSMNENETDEHGHMIRVAVADNPKGPFVYKKTILEPFSIDAHTVETLSGLYIFYCNNDYESERAGTRIMCDKMRTPFQVEGKPRCVVWPTLDEEIYQKNRFRAGQHWHTIEGAFYFFYQGTHFLMYSGACYQNPTYFIGYCTAEGEENADLRTLDWKKYPDENTYAPLLTKNEEAEGFGHNSVLFDNGKGYIIYHGSDYGDMEKAQDLRSARIDELLIENNQLKIKKL